MYRSYTYEGPVMEFDRVIDNRWTAETKAVSEKKAKSNLTHQFKVSHNRSSNTKITLPGNMTAID